MSTKELKEHSFKLLVFCFEGSMSSSDLVAFLSGLLLGGDTKARNWFSSFVRIGQKVWKHLE